MNLSEILFRGKRLDNGEWVGGHVYTTVHFQDTIEEEWYCFINPVGCYPTHAYQVDPDTLGQYIGKKDKEGRRIFTGDLLRLSENGKSYEVKFADGSFYMEGTSVPIKFAHKLLVVGNIYDNPELR